MKQVNLLMFEHRASMEENIIAPIFNQVEVIRTEVFNRLRFLRAMGMWLLDMDFPTSLRYNRE